MIILWLTAILILITQGGLACLNCKYDFNRMPKKLIPCAVDYSDCGDCIPGLIRDPVDDRICFNLAFWEISGDVTKDRDSEVYLICRFNARVKCTWSKDGKEVNITKPYNWIRGNGTEGDCDIVIEHLSERDTGKWVCSNRANSDVHSIYSSDIMVAITTRIIPQPEPKYLNVSSGESITIECQFDHPVKCSWMKNGRPVESWTNYYFSETESTTDCSLTIHSFDLTNDQGNWTCFTSRSSEKEPIVSRTAIVLGYQIPVVDHDKDSDSAIVTVVSGDESMVIQHSTNIDLQFSNVYIIIILVCIVFAVLMIFTLNGLIRRAIKERRAAKKAQTTP